MTIGFVVEVIRDGVFQIMMIAAPILLVGMTVGLIVSIFQATTSIQEQTLTFVPKIAAILLTLALFGPWMLGQMKSYTIELLMKISEMTY